MPVKGVIFILMCAIIYGVIERNKIYKWLTSEISDDDNKSEKEE